MLGAAIAQVIAVHRGDHDVRRPMSATVCASLSGSTGSGGLGRPWATSQNEQRRVHTSPRIMKVAVPWLKHSWMFGQRPLRTP
jgi:hypothetical protein